MVVRMFSICEKSHRKFSLDKSTIESMEVAEVGSYENLLDFFRKRGIVMRCSKGEVVVHADDEPFGVFYIESGFVKVFSLNTLGTEYIHVVYGPGEYFPMIWMVRHVRRNMFYETMAPCTLLKVRPGELEAALEADAHLCIDVIKQSTEQAGIFLDRIHNLEFRFARERLVYCLLYLAKRFGVPKDGGSEIALRVSHQILASNINLSRESVGRELERLERKDMVVVSGGRIFLKDIPALVRQLPGAVHAEWFDEVQARD